MRAAPNYAPDDGWILKYRIYGDIDPRLEYVHVSSYATRGIVPVNVGGEYRSVMVFDEGGVRRLEEAAVSATVGAVLNGGVEWTPSSGRQPTIRVSLIGFDAQLQGNQAMLGFVNPAGIGGGQIGAEFSVPGGRELRPIHARGLVPGTGFSVHRALLASASHSLAPSRVS